MVVEGKLSEGHARALLGAAEGPLIEDLADKAVRGRLSVRKVEALVRQQRQNGADESDKPKKDAESKSANVRDLEQRLTRLLGHRVEVRDRSGKGEVVIAYANLDELDQVLAALGLE